MQLPEPLPTTREGVRDSLRLGTAYFHCLFYCEPYQSMTAVAFAKELEVFAYYPIPVALRLIVDFSLS